MTVKTSTSFSNLMKRGVLSGPIESVTKRWQSQSLEG